MMNSKQRLEAAKLIRKAHDYEHPSRFKSIDVSGSGILLLMHNHRAELLELHADAERELSLKQQAHEDLISDYHLNNARANEAEREVERLRSKLNSEIDFNRNTLFVKLADRDRDIERLREYVAHSAYCGWLLPSSSNSTRKGECDCGLDELLNQETSDG